MGYPRSAALFAILCIALVASCTQESTPIGFVGPLSGDAALYGLEDYNAALLAVEQLNSQGGIGGIPVRLIAEDGKCNGKDAASAAQKLISADGVEVILGGTCSSETLAMAPVTEASGVLLFSSVSTSPEVAGAGDFVFRNAPSDVASADATARLATERGVREIATITENTDYALAFTAVFEERFGGRISVSETYDSDDTDFRAQITKALSHDPDAVLIVTQGTLGLLVAKQLREQGFNGPLYGNLILAQTHEQDPAVLEGLIYADSAGLDPSRPQAQEFLKAYRARFGEDPGFGFFAAARYDSVGLLAEAIAKVGYDAERIRQHLDGLGSYEGSIGTFGFDPNGDVEGIEWAEYQIRDGEPARIG